MELWGIGRALILYKFIVSLSIFTFVHPAAMSNQELINAGMKTMDETDQTIERSKMVSAQSHHGTSSLMSCILF